MQTSKTSTLFQYNGYSSINTCPSYTIQNLMGTDLNIKDKSAVNIKAKRNSNFEMLRIIAMLMIVIGHLYKFWYESDSPESARNLENLFTPWFLTNQGVDIFILISGVFGINASLRKYANLWITIVYYSFISAIICVIFMHIPASKIIIWPLRDALVVPTSFWFIASYFALMLISPFINTLFKKPKITQLVYLCIFCYVDFIFQTMRPGFYGLTTWGGALLHFTTLYILGRIITLWNIRYNITVCIFAYILIVLGGYFLYESRLYSGSDTSVWIVFPSVCLILIFKSIKPFYNSVINNIAKASLGVYCFHARSQALVALIANPILFITYERYGNLPALIAAIIMAGAIYLITLPFDWVRLKYSYVPERIITTLYTKLKVKLQNYIH